MRPPVAFINSDSELEVFNSSHKGVGLVRMTLQGARKFKNKLPHAELWLDTGWDGFGEQSRSPDWIDYVQGFPGGKDLTAPNALAHPDKKRIQGVATAMLQACTEFQPYAVTVPSLPVGTTNAAQEAGKINRWLAEAANIWKATSKFGGRLVVPVVLTNQKQYLTKAERNKVVTACKRQMDLSCTDVYWVADSSLADQDGTGTFAKRFPALLELHRELMQALPSASDRWAGPYWCMNLVLWSLGLVTRPAIGVGGSFQYHLSGGFIKTPIVRLALTPLRRWAESDTNQFRAWLDQTLAVVPKSDPAHEHFASVRREIDVLNDRPAAKKQVARVYDQWLLELEGTPQSGRSLLLYQQLSSAYVLGRSLPDLPTKTSTARRPERVAQQHMLICL